MSYPKEGNKDDIIAVLRWTNEKNHGNFLRKGLRRSLTLMHYGVDPMGKTCLVLAILLGLFAASLGCKGKFDEIPVAATAPVDTGKSHEEAVAAYNRGDYATAVKLWRPLAEQGHADAQCGLGFMYENGHLVPQDHREAVKWFRKAAEQGNAAAQFNMGLAYGNGRGVPQDLSEAAKWYQKAAEQGLAGAQTSIGNAYYNGKGVPRDHSEAVKWWKKAADQGEATAQFNLGAAYTDRNAVIQQSTSIAVDWYYKSGLGFLKEGKTDTALIALDRINTISPGHELGKSLEKAIYPDVP